MQLFTTAKYITKLNPWQLQTVNGSDTAPHRDESC